MLKGRMPALFILVVLAQSGAPAAEGEHLDRIRSAVSVKPAITVPADPDDTGRLVFHVNVQAWTFTGRPWDQGAKSVPDYVRPTMPLPHYEFLQMVTPEDFRASTLYHPPLSVTFDPVVVKKFFSDWRRAVAERKAGEEVRRDFAAYLRASAESR
jgi:hypothetical protein